MGGSRASEKASYGECPFGASCGLAYCKITVVENKDSVRGSIADDNGGAVEAHSMAATAYALSAREDE